MILYISLRAFMKLRKPRASGDDPAAQAAFNVVMK